MTHRVKRAAIARAWGKGMLAVAWFAMVPMALHGQTVATPEDEYKKLVKVNDDIQPLGDTPFGERIGLYDGSLSFEQVDVSVPGTGPTITIGREFTLHTLDDRPDLQNRAFGDWDLALPEITTTTANQRNVTGWAVDAANPKDVCTSFNAPPSVAAPPGDAARSDWEPDSWWQGYKLIVPGQTTQDLLSRSAANIFSPSSNFIQASYPTYPVVTTGDWGIGCVQHASTDPTSQSFLAISPDGTRYWLDHLSYRYMPSIRRPLFSSPLARSVHTDAVLTPLASVDDFLTRREGRMLVTRVQDRFGNWIAYTYSGDQVTDITASDGRHVSIAYEAGTPRISSVTVQGNGAGTRTWTYAYTKVGLLWQLTSIRQPDGSTWGFDLTDLNNAWVDMRESPGSCDAIGAPGNFGTNYTGRMTHPSGLSASFTVTAVKRGRSNVPRLCEAGPNQPSLPTASGTWATLPDAWYNMAIVQRQLSGTGLGIGGSVGTQTWNYSYSPANESWSQNCNGSCTGFVWTKVIFPDGHAERNSYSNRYDYSEAKLLSEEVFDGDADTTARRRLTQYAYVDPNPSKDARANAYPHPWGFVPQRRVNAASMQDKIPMASRVITEEGDTYSWNALSFDAFARAHDVQRFNSVGFGVQEHLVYLDDPAHWVIGLFQRKDNVSAGETVSSYVYSPVDQTLQERDRFGHKVMSYAYNAQGQLASFTDANNHTTSLQNYYRGIPRAILYPDGTAQTLAVDDLGQITAIANQKGDVTSYGYDAMGRLSTIVYPGGDSTAWNTTSIAYDFMPAPDRNIGGVHWRRTLIQGGDIEQTYYDAMLRPIIHDSHTPTNNPYWSNRTDYDWKGRTTYQSYWFTGAPFPSAMSNGKASFYDALDRLTMTRHTSEIGDLVTSTTYLSGARKQVVDAKGQATTMSYQAFDEPGWDQVVRVEAPENVVQTVARDTYGNPLSITQGGAGQSVTKTMAYDDQHRLCRIWQPESGSDISAYDDADNVVWNVSGASFNGSGCGQDQVIDSLKTVHGYDAMNRVTSIVYPSGTLPSTFTYDALGNAATATSGSVSWTFGRNKRALLTNETLSVDGHNWTLGYAYDGNGILSAISYPDGEVVPYSPNPVGQPTMAGRYVTAVSQFKDGAIQFYSMGSGATYVGTKNLRDTIGQFTFNKGGVTPVISEVMTFDANGNVTQFADVATNNTRTKSIGYDGLDRIVSATASNLWGTETYTYDTLGNIRSLGNASGTNTYNYDPSNRLTSIVNGATTLHAYRYDGQGNTVGRDATNLVFDLANRLVSVDGKATYTYDAAGRRVKKVTSAGTKYYAYNDAGKLMWEYEAATGMGINYIYLDGKLVANSRGPSGTGKVATYYYTDPQGTPLATTNESAQFIDTTDHKPYGGYIIGRGVGEMGYTGQIQDDESGLNYVQARYYDADAGRFQSIDPKSLQTGNLAGFNRYAYGNNNPYLFVDPDGKAPAMLTDLKRTMQPIVRDGRKFITQVARYFLDRPSTIEASADAKVGAAGAAVGASKSLYNGSDSVGVSRAGKGLSFEVAASMKMEVANIDLSPGTDISRTSYVGHIAAYEGLGGGVEVKFNAGGKVSVSLIAGTGEGETAWAGEITSDLADPQQHSDMQDKLRDDEVRRQIGIPRDTD